MFTGIIQAVGSVINVERTPRRHGATVAHRLDLDAGDLLNDVQLGASVAVNGVCLTLAARSGSQVGFDVVPETWSRSTLGRLAPGARVNLERSLRVGDPLDGHFVQGHVDAIGKIDAVDRNAGEWRVWVQTDAALLPLVTPKGSVAIDGTSLTVADLEASRFSVALVPTTLEKTVLQHRQPGDAVNIETDILARLVRQRLASITGSGSAAMMQAGLTWQQLQEGGFIA